MNDILVFNQSDAVEFAGNTFINVPTILAVDGVALVETTKTVDTSYTLQFSIYHPDGTYLAKVKGTQLYPTEEGRKAGLTFRHPDKMTVCELGDETLFEVRREHAAALKLTAELYTPQGVFVTSKIQGCMAFSSKGGLQIGGFTMAGGVIKDCQFGIVLMTQR